MKDFKSVTFQSFLISHRSISSFICNLTRKLRYSFLGGFSTLPAQHFRSRTNRHHQMAHLLSFHPPASLFISIPSSILFSIIYFRSREKVTSANLCEAIMYNISPLGPDTNWRVQHHSRVLM